MNKSLPHGIGALGIRVIVALEYVGKEKQFHYQEYKHEFDDYKCPQLPPYGHGAETVGIKPKDSRRKVAVSP